MYEKKFKILSCIVEDTGQVFSVGLNKCVGDTFLKFVIKRKCKRHFFQSYYIALIFSLVYKKRLGGKNPKRIYFSKENGGCGRYM